MKAISKKYILSRQFLACLLVLAMMMVTAVPMPAYAAPAPFAGSGTKADPCLITSAEDLLKLAELVNDGGTAYATAGVCYKLAQDISLSNYGKSYNSGKGWVPIGVGDALNPFNGNFNGDGHKITGLYINDDIANAGLFGIVSVSATVEKVILNGAEIEAINNVGGIAGEVKGTITDCAYLSLADGTDSVRNTMNSVGGIAGYVDTGGIVKNCYSTGRVSGVAYVGGVAGTVDGTVHDCYSTSYVSGSNHVGGVAGQVAGTMQNCYSTGIIDGMSLVGGITGLSFGTVEHCAALNRYVNASNSCAGRVAGFKNAGTLSDNMAFDGMSISENGREKDISATARQNDVDGETRTAGVLQMSGGFPPAMAQSPWVYESAKMPGLGEAVDMPSYLVPSDLAITTGSLPAGAVGTTYNVRLQASGGSNDPNNYTWSAAGIPQGMRITSTGRLCGMPAAANSYSVSIKVTDSSEHKSVTKVFPLIIAAAQDSPLSHWTERSKPISLSGSSVYDIAYNGSTFVGVGDGIMASADGAAWTAVKAAEQLKAYQGIAYGNGTFVAAGWQPDSGMISTKTAGGAWEEKTPLGIKSLEGVAYAGNNTFIAVGDNTVLVSTDSGNNWSAVTPPTLPGGVTFRLHGIAADENGHAVAVGDSSNGHSIIWYSADRGTTWSATASLIEETRLNCVAYGDQAFIAMGNDGIAYLSGDGGETWEYSELPGAQDMMPPAMYKIAFGGNTFVAVGQCEEGQFNVISSGDKGVTWTGRLTAPDLDFQAIAYGNNSFVKAGYEAAGGAGRLYQSDPLVPIKPDENGGHHGTGGGSSAVQPQAPSARMLDSSGKLLNALTATWNSGTGAASVEIDTASLTDAFDNVKASERGMKTVTIEIPLVNGAKTYEPTLPASFLTSGNAAETVEIKTGIASVKVAGNMLTKAEGAAAQKVAITIAAADKSRLSDELQAQIGQRPVIELNLKIDGKRTDWSNESAPVAVSIPYTPTKEELKDPEHIIIWYVDGSGKAVSVPSGCYDPAAGTVTFNVSHFSEYAVGYNQVVFADVTVGAWYHKAVGFVAARDITAGTGGDKFSPKAKLTRGQFLVMMMRAYGMAPDPNASDNFADAGDAYYTGYLAAAKQSGISGGVGNNLFAPNKEITRQEMFTMLYNALKKTGSLPEGSKGKPLTVFRDSGDVASWARDAMAWMTETGIVTGSGSELSPKDTATRAEMAQLVYNLLSIPDNAISRS